MYGVAFNSTSGLLVAVGDDNSGTTANAVYATSSNGTTWTTPAIMGSPTPASAKQVAINTAGTFVAVGVTADNNYPMYAIST
jgi:hypothetical protein